MWYSHDPVEKCYIEKGTVLVVVDAIENHAIVIVFCNKRVFHIYDHVFKSFLVELNLEEIKS